MARTQLDGLRIPLVLGVSMLLTPLNVKADSPGAGGTRVVYRASQGCPSEAEFLAQVGARIPKPSAPGRSSPAQSLVVTLSAIPGGAVGRLETSIPGGAAGWRVVRGRTCAEVASALALFTALAIDPRAAEKADIPANSPPSAPPAASPAPSTTPSATRATPASPEAPAPAAEMGAGPAPPEATTARARQTGSAPTNAEQRVEDAARVDADLGPGPAREPDSLSRDTASGRKKWEREPAGARMGAGGIMLGSLTTGSVLPRTAAGLSAFFELSIPHLGRHRWSLLYFFDVHAPAATFQALGGRWDVAPWQLPLGPTTELEPGVAAELLRVTANAHATGDVTAGSASRAFVAADLFARIRYRPLPGVLASLEAGAEAPLTRYVFRLGTEGNDRGILHQVPALGWMLGLHVGGPLL